MCLSYSKSNVNKMKATDRVHQVDILLTTLGFETIAHQTIRFEKIACNVFLHSRSSNLVQCTHKIIEFRLDCKFNDRTHATRTQNPNEVHYCRNVHFGRNCDDENMYEAHHSSPF